VSESPLIHNLFYSCTPRNICSDLVPYKIYNQKTSFRMFWNEFIVFNIVKKIKHGHRLIFEQTLQKIIPCLKYARNNKIKRLIYRSLRIPYTFHSSKTCYKLVNKKNIFQLMFAWLINIVRRTFERSSCFVCDRFQEQKQNKKPEGKQNPIGNTFQTLLFLISRRMAKTVSNTSAWHAANRVVTRLDGARGKKQIWRPHIQT